MSENNKEQKKGPKLPPKKATLPPGGARKATLPPGGGRKQPYQAKVLHYLLA